MRREQEMGFKMSRRNQQKVQSRWMVVGGYQLQEDGYMMNWRQRVVDHVKLAAGKNAGGFRRRDRVFCWLPLRAEPIANQRTEWSQASLARRPHRQLPSQASKNTRPTLWSKHLRQPKRADEFVMLSLFKMKAPRRESADSAYQVVIYGVRSS